MKGAGGLSNRPSSSEGASERETESARARRLLRGTSQVGGGCLRTRARSLRARLSVGVGVRPVAAHQVPADAISEHHQGQLTKTPQRKKRAGKRRKERPEAKGSERIIRGGWPGGTSIPGAGPPFIDAPDIPHPGVSPGTGQGAHAGPVQRGRPAGLSPRLCQGAVAAGRATGPVRDCPSLVLRVALGIHGAGSMVACV